jgi:hypothetical protein
MVLRRRLVLAPRPQQAQASPRLKCAAGTTAGAGRRDGREQARAHRLGGDGQRRHIPPGVVIRRLITRAQLAGK